ncbi:MAG: hypothetical protein FWE13_04780 [Firmicutes bacterium]|nr:hypothetical protein [Bacillota bacterium]
MQEPPQIDGIVEPSEISIKKSEPQDFKPKIKVTKWDIVLLCIPIVGLFFVLVRMLFKINSHFVGKKLSIYGPRFWRFWLWGVFIMLVSMIISFVPVGILLAFEYRFDIVALEIIFIYIVTSIFGFTAYFLTNLILNKTRPTALDK